MLALLWRLPCWFHTLLYWVTRHQVVMIEFCQPPLERHYHWTTHKHGTDRPLL